ncbi:MAG: 50S ribosomal protein L6 [Candidatus Bathyarchaeota archaeon]|jgi:large subunit ribosomal protein L6
MRATEVSKTIQIPEEVQLSVDGRKVMVKGPKGLLTRDFSHAPVSISIGRKELRIWTEWPRKKEAALVGTIQSHIKNMITGVRTGFTYKMKIVFSHFPISVKLEDEYIFIENFTGERKPRRVKRAGNVQINVLSDDIIIQGIDLEEVSQTAANIEQATKVKRKDSRVFLDGIYVFERNEGMEE